MAAIPGRCGCWFLAAATAILLCAISIAHAVGEADPLFHPDINGVVSIVIPQLNGQILIGGNFTRINGLTRKRFARLNPNGSLDTSFSPVVNGEIDTIALQPDNRSIVSGAFNQINGTNKSFMARLNTDGSLDPSLDAGLDWLSPGWGRPSIQQMVVQQDGKILVAGRITVVHGVATPGLARLNSDGSLDSGFNVTGIYFRDLQPGAASKWEAPRRRQF